MNKTVKSTPRKRGVEFELTPPAPKTRSGVATYKQLVKVAHLVLDAKPALIHDEGELEEAVKWKLGEWRLQVTADGYAGSHLLRRAILAAVYQRKHVFQGSRPAWQPAWREKQRREKLRRAGFR